MKSLIIFDFDGVIVDSEVFANQALADGLSRIGLATTLDDALAFYMGKRWGDCVAEIESRHGLTLPASFIEGARLEATAAVKDNIRAIPGVVGFIDRFADLPRCIASSSDLPYIAASLQSIGLDHRFEHRFSAQDVERGKPHPDVYLLAASTLDRRPSECIVIEDSVSGVMAGVAAGMLTIGLCAGGHIRDGHAERLDAAGADHVVGDYEAVAAIVAPLLNG